MVFEWIYEYSSHVKRNQTIKYKRLTDPLRVTTYEVLLKHCSNRRKNERKLFTSVQTENLHLDCHFVERNLIFSFEWALVYVVLQVVNVLLKSFVDFNFHFGGYNENDFYLFEKDFNVHIEFVWLLFALDYQIEEFWAIWTTDELKIWNYFGLVSG